MPRERRWAKDGPSTRAPGTMMERTNPERSGGPDGGASPFGSFWGAGHPGDCQKEPAQQGGTNASTNPKISSGTNKRRGIALRGYPLYELMFQQTRKRAAARKCKQAARSIRQTPSPLPLSQKGEGLKSRSALRAPRLTAVVASASTPQHSPVHASARRHLHAASPVPGRHPGSPAQPPA